MLDKEIVKEKEEERIKTEDITDEIEFAAFGQQVIRNGEITDLGTIAQQFSDVRHLFKLPNLGDVSQIKKEVGKVVGGALWFGENQLIRIQDWDRRRGALSRPVELDWSYIRQREGFQKRSTEEWRRIVAEAFRLKGYRRIERDERPPQEPGEFRFDPANTNLVDCSTSFLRNGYA